MNRYFYGRQSISSGDIKSVLKSLRSNTISQGQELNKLEKKVAKYCGAKYCVAVSSGTAALHLSVLSLNLKKNFLALTSPITFVATTNVILLADGKFDLIDINSKNLNFDPNLFKKYLFDRIKKRLPLPKLVIPVHFGGLSPEMTKIYSLCKKYNIKIIEDASQSMGGSYMKRRIGSCKFSDLTVFSLHPVKTITCGEGGLILTNNKMLYKKILELRINGIQKNSSKSWEHDMKNIGYNYKISEINCALANSQLKRINSFILKRKKIAKFYTKYLDSKKLFFQEIIPNAKSAWHLFIIIFKKSLSSRNKNLFYNNLKKKNIFLDVKYRPIQTFSGYKKKYKFLECKKSADYFKQSFCLPMHVNLNSKDLKYICSNINKTIDNMKL